MPSTPSTPPIRALPDTQEARVLRRKEQNRILRRAWRRLKRKKKIIAFNDDNELDEMLITRGTPFDIDQDDPIDFEPRFFLPGPVEVMEGCLQLSQEERGASYKTCEWPQLEPLEIHQVRAGDARDYHEASHVVLSDAVAHSEFCEAVATNWEVGGVCNWEAYIWVPRSMTASYDQYALSVYDSRPCWHMFHPGSYYLWPSFDWNLRWEPGQPPWSLDVPHAVGTVCDNARPRCLSQGLLRSELLMAVSLLKVQMSPRDMTHMGGFCFPTASAKHFPRGFRYLDHDIHPVLVVSFHGRFSARVVQAHISNRRIVVRSSRFLNLYTRDVSPDVRLALRWLNSRPVGETRKLTPHGVEVPDDDVDIRADDLDMRADDVDVQGDGSSRAIASKQKPLSLTIPVR